MIHAQPKTLEPTQAVIPQPDELDLGSWFIIRTAISDTLRLAKDLCERGIVAWTPVDRRTRRRPRAKKRQDIEFPMMPTYIFVRMEHLDMMLAHTIPDAAGLSPWRVFQYGGGIPLIADRELIALREEENRVRYIFERAKRRFQKPPKIPIGTEICLRDGAFAGLTGRVEEQQGNYALVAYEGFDRTIKISSLLLHEAV